jgi:hypothetical protein
MLWTLLDGLPHPGHRDRPIRTVSSVHSPPLCVAPRTRTSRAENLVDLGLHDPSLPLTGDIERFRAPKLRKTQILTYANRNSRSLNAQGRHKHANATQSSFVPSLYHRLARAAERELTSRYQRATLGQSLGTSKPMIFAKSIEHSVVMSATVNLPPATNGLSFN